MELHKVKINELISPEWNPRTITDEDLQKLRISIDEFGYIEPIIVNKHNNHIVGGNQRAKALQKLGYNEVDCIYVDIKDINKEKACNVALNKISGEWDNDKLKVVLEDIELSDIDVSLTGFEEIELTEMEILHEPTHEDITEDDYEPEDDLETDIQHGDLFKLGNHYLLCGDSTIEEEVNTLLSAGGERERALTWYSQTPHIMH